MDETNVGDVSSQLNIKSRRKSMINKKMLMQIEDNKINNKKDITDSSSKRASLVSNCIGDLKLRLNDTEITKTKQRKRRKSEFIRPVFELNNYLTLKATLIDIPELIVQQESDIIEAIIGCQQPNNYHVYGRLPNGEVSYLFKFREFSGCAMRVLCPVNCRQFTMKMKAVASYENKYDNNFTNSILNIEKNFKIPCFCLIRPDMKVDLIQDKTRLGTVEQTFSWCDPSFTIYNENDEEVKFITADCCQCGLICRNTSLGKTDDVHFFIYNPKDMTKPIGDICKKTESIFSIADSYSISYPVKIPPEEKILLTIVAIMIDYQFFEKNNVK
jgi:hypothetical protein